MGIWNGILGAVYDKTNGGLDVNIQDSTNPLFQYYLMDEQKTDITLTTPISIDDTVINVSAGHGFTAAAGEVIVIWESNNYMQLKVISVATNAITVEYPVSNAFTVGSIVIRGNINMNINGSITPVDFKMRIQDFTSPIDITKFVITMTHGAAGDDGKFGGITALTNGVYFRKINTVIQNLGNFTTNQKFKDLGAVVAYTSKGPGGVEATDIVFDIKNVFGQVLRFDAALSDELDGHVRDDLTLLTKFTASAIGSYTIGEESI